MNFLRAPGTRPAQQPAAVVLFVLAVIAIVIAVNVAATSFITCSSCQPVCAGLSAAANGFYFTNTVVVLGLILGVPG